MNVIGRVVNRGILVEGDWDEGRRIGPERMCAESARRGGEAEVLVDKSQ